jgi:hypothetical protein
MQATSKQLAQVFPYANKTKTKRVVWQQSSQNLSVSSGKRAQPFASVAIESEGSPMA